jgi:hypothetical protein
MRCLHRRCIRSKCRGMFLSMIAWPLWKEGGKAPQALVPAGRRARQHAPRVARGRPSSGTTMVGDTLAGRPTKRAGQKGASANKTARAQRTNGSPPRVSTRIRLVSPFRALVPNGAVQPVGLVPARDALEHRLAPAAATPDAAEEARPDRLPGPGELGGALGHAGRVRGWLWFVHCEPGCGVDICSDLGAGGGF